MAVSSALKVAIKAGKDVQRTRRKLDRIATNKMQASLNKALRAATKETRKELKQAPLNALPKGGGLNKWAARTPTIRIQIKGRTQGVSIRLKRTGHDMAALNRGRLRHPVFYGDVARAQGRKRAWVTQPVPARWWDAAKAAQGPQIIDEVTATLKAAISKEWRTP